MNQRIFFRNILVLLFLLLPQFAFTMEDYNPLAVSDSNVQTIELTVKDEKRNRQIPLLIYLQTNRSSSPVILFSHGLGGSREGNSYLGLHWASRGYVAVFLQHPGSDASLLENTSKIGRFVALKQAANTENFLLRVQDVSSVLDQLEAWNTLSSNPLHNKLDMNRVGMSGHSFGAVTTQAVSGQSFKRNNISYTDNRIKAAIMLSPRWQDRNSKETFSSVRIPWMLMTGTLDNALIREGGGVDAKSRREVYKALPVGEKYELVLDGAEHSAFGDRALPIDKMPRNPNHHRAVLALSTAFWDSYLKDNASARSWLDGDSVRGVLEQKDIWQRK